MPDPPRNSVDALDGWLAAHPPRPTDRFGRHEPLAGWSWRPRLADHDLWLVRQGSGTARIDGEAPIPLSPGTLLLLRPGDRGRFTQDAAAPVAVTFCHFSLAGAGPGASWPAGAAPARTHRVELAGPAASGLEAAVAALASNAPMARLRAQSLLAGALADLLHLPDRVRPDSDAERARRVASLVDADPAARPRAADLAAAVGVPTRALAPLLREHLGMPLRAYLLESRLRRAQVLVGETDLPIATIAAMLGYVDHTLFSRQFAARFGRSPRAYRST